MLRLTTELRGKKSDSFYAARPIQPAFSFRGAEPLGNGVIQSNIPKVCWFVCSSLLASLVGVVGVELSGRFLVLASLRHEHLLHWPYCIVFLALTKFQLFYDACVAKSAAREPSGLFHELKATRTRHHPNHQEGELHTSVVFFSFRARL